jgi:hypothetical protein
MLGGKQSAKSRQRVRLPDTVDSPVKKQTYNMTKISRVNRRQNYLLLYF